MPAQPGAAGPARVPLTRARPAVAQPAAGRDGTPRGAGGPRDPRRRRTSPRSRGPGRWGTWQGGLGVCIIVASAAIGAGGTIVTKNAPGLLLEVSVVAGTVAAALAVRPRAGRMILPVPALAYLVAALVSGVVFDRAAGSSRTELALAAAQWIANGFFAMVLATVLAVAITTARWYLWRRGRLDSPPARDRGWTAADPARPGGRTGQAGPAQSRPAQSKPAQSKPAQGGPAQAGRRPRTAWGTQAESGYPAGYTGRRGPGGAVDATGAWNEPGPRGTGSRPGPSPYNFSSGA